MKWFDTYIGKRGIAFVAIAGLAIGLVAFTTGCGKKADQQTTTPKEKTLYTCGMHPQVIQDHPGNCPICGMKLTPIRKQDGAAGTVADTHTIVVDPATVQNMGIRTAVVTRGPLRRVIRTVAVIDYDEAALAGVTTKFKGWIEKLYVDATGQQVHRGDPLFEIYSPELYSAQEEYLLAIGSTTNSMPGLAELRASARAKLKFFDISDEQIAELETTRQPRKTLRILAPMDGFVIKKLVVEGQMVDAGMKLYELADLGLVWVQAQIYEQDLMYIKLGEEATVTLASLPDREFRGRVTYIYPTVDEKTRTARVRMEFHNPGYFLKPGMFATVRVAAELEPSVLLVPAMAVLRSGEKTTVFVTREGGKFDPRTVTLGPQAEDDMYQVLDGLKEGERIVTSGQFMLDSESQLREAIEKMREPGESGGAEERGSGGAWKREGVGASDVHHAAHAPRSTAVIYICPMPEHVSIEYNHPGNCPICGMTLVPVSQATLHKIQPGGKLLYYTCPMPEHGDVREEKAGKCPKCGMTLIPVMEQQRESVERRSVERQSVGEHTTLHAPDAPHAPRSTPPTPLYTCPMAEHADVVFDKPGKCPKCEMDLVTTDKVGHGKVAEENWRKMRTERP